MRKFVVFVLTCGCLLAMLGCPSRLRTIFVESKISEPILVYYDGGAVSERIFPGKTLALDRQLWLTPEFELTFRRVKDKAILGTLVVTESARAQIDDGSTMTFAARRGHWKL